VVLAVLVQRGEGVRAGCCLTFLPGAKTGCCAVVRVVMRRVVKKKERKEELGRAPKNKKMGEEV